MGLLGLASRFGGSSCHFISPRARKLNALNQSRRLRHSLFKLPGLNPRQLTSDITIDQLVFSDLKFFKLGIVREIMLLNTRPFFIGESSQEVCHGAFVLITLPRQRTLPP